MKRAYNGAQDTSFLAADELLVLLSEIDPDLNQSSDRPAQSSDQTRGSSEK